MKNVLAVLLLGYGVTRPLPAQSTEKVTVGLKNNGPLPREFKFLTRRPADKYPDVFTAFLAPGAVYRVDFPVGTAIAQVTQAEIYATMNGRTVTGKPLLVVTPGDQNKTVDLIYPRKPQPKTP